MSKIISIEDYSGKAPGLNYGMFGGYKITTDEDEIFILMYDEQCCCEDFGYLMSEDDFSGYIGSDLIKVNALNVDKTLVKIEEQYEDCAIFINIETTSGTLQFAAYNDHNGYYGHTVVVCRGDGNIDYEDSI